MKTPIPPRHPILSVISTIILVTCFILISESKAQEQMEEIIYELAISFDMENGQLNGTAYLKIPANRDIALSFHGITPTGVMVKNSGSPQTFSAPREMAGITIESRDVAQELFVSFEKIVASHHDNFIENNGIALLSHWFPYPSERVLFSLDATVPQGFTALAESDVLPQKSKGTAHFSFSQPTTSINFIAAPYRVSSMKVREGLSVYTYFFQEDHHLAPGYLEAAKAFLLRYEKMIGEYPYNHFVIAANQRPTGYGMPTFTLLGKQVLRLPFIKKTSLGHEILHSWFGNSIEIDSSEGNWSEGLTSYLADWLYREDKDEGVIHRKEQLLKYHSYVNQNNPIPLRSFLSASNNQRMARAVRSVGYIKGAMFFHELHRFIGKDDFYKGIREFYATFRSNEAAWSDLREVFENTSGKNLERFFSERLNAKDTKDLAIDHIQTTSSPGGTSLNFTIQQLSAKPFQFILPVRVVSPNGDKYFYPMVSKETQKISLLVESRPTNIVIDPEYDLMRTLSSTEDIAVLSSLLGRQEVIVVKDSQDVEPYQPFTDFSRNRGWAIKMADELSAKEMNGENLVILGKNNPLSLSLFGPFNHPNQGASISARKHPLSPEKYVLQVSASSGEELQRALTKLRHYGKYSYLHFQGGRLVTQRFSPEPMGHKITLGQEPMALPAAHIQDFETVMQKIRQARVVYLGESHTSMEDHHLQYLVLENFIQNNEDVAIGMEMFPASVQNVLDQYIYGNPEMTEREFLKRSRYFEVWRYDYRYYQNIIDLARKHKVPLIGLNIEREVVSSVYQNGSTAKLTEEQKKLLPRERDHSLPGYFERLQAIHGLHPHGKGNQAGLGGFIQAQAVWDEVMAENIAKYLKSNPSKKMLVIAGSEHGRKDNGIPPRVLRRLNVSQAAVMTVNERRSPSPTMADYFFYMDPMKLSPQGKIGVSLAEEEESGETLIKIGTLLSGSNAGKAGLRIGDIITTIDGFSISSMEDIQVALAGKEAGENIVMEVRRKSPGSDKKQIFTIKLYDPASARKSG